MSSNIAGLKLLSRAVQFDSYGDVDVLEVRDVPRPVPGANEVLVEVRAAGINPSEAVIRTGALADQFPATFPSGQGSDLAGVVAELGSGVNDFVVGDEVIAFSMRRSSHAEFVTVPSNQLTAKPSEVSWEVAGSLFVAGATAFGAVRAIHLKPGETVAIAGAAGGVGSIAVQLARRAGAHVLGIAGPYNDGWLIEHGVTPVNYGDDLPARLRAAAPSGRIDALLDFFGGGYVAMAIEDLEIPRDRVDTIADFAAVEQFGVLSAGGADAATAEVVAELADLVAHGELEVPIAGVFAIDDVRDAFRQVELRHTRGKVVLRISQSSEEKKMSDGNAFNARNIAEFRANHGRVGGPFEGAPMVIVHSVGAKSGQPRTNIMMYLADGDRYLVFASNNGRDDNPAWYWNLMANPDTRIEVGDDTVEVHATELRGAERDEKYAVQAERYPGFAEYARQTSRTIPVVALTPTA
jgi:deazaflavin-dependent oxidoreductase (nitroreductase family)